MGTGQCDEETTTQTDVDNGLVNIVIGFAPLKAAEFVIIKIQQVAGQLDGGRCDQRWNRAFERFLEPEGGALANQQ